MNKLSKWTLRILSILVAIALVSIFFGSIQIFRDTYMIAWHVKLAIVLSTGALISILACCSKLKAKYKILIVLSVAFVIRLLWILNVRSVPVSDFLTMYDTAKGFLNGNTGPLRDYGYLARFPHLVPMTVYMMSMIKIFGSCHIIAMKCVSLILSVVTVYLVYVLAGYYVKKENSKLVAAVIAALYPPFISYSSTYCTETIGVPLFILSVIMFHKAINADKKQPLHFLACGAVLYCSNMFRGVAIIFLIAFGLYILIFSKKSRIISVASILAGYFIVSVLASSVLMVTGVIEQPLWKAKEPSYVTLMLKGSNFEHNGTWNPDDANFVEQHLGDKDLSKKCLDVIQKRLSEKSPSEIAGFYLNKFVTQWTMGDCSGTYWATMQTDTPYNYPLPKPFQLIYVFVIFLTLCVFFTREKHPPLALMFLLLCGFGTAFMLLETQGRYSYIVSWVFIILAAYGFENLNSENELIKKLRDLYLKYKVQINYVVFGVVTTAVNVAVYYIFYNKLYVGNIASTIIAWLLSVITAYITNKIWVFESKSFKPAVLLKEMGSFFACRFLTGVFDVGIMWLGVDLLHFNSTVIKILSNVIVIVLNYIVSKLIIFKNKTEE